MFSILRSFQPKGSLVYIVPPSVSLHHLHFHSITIPPPIISQDSFDSNTSDVHKKQVKKAARSTMAPSEPLQVQNSFVRAVSYIPLESLWSAYKIRQQRNIRIDPLEFAALFHRLIRFRTCPSSSFSNHDFVATDKYRDYLLHQLSGDWADWIRSHSPPYHISQTIKALHLEYLIYTNQTEKAHRLFIHPSVSRSQHSFKILEAIVRGFFIQGHRNKALRSLETLLSHSRWKHAIPCETWNLIVSRLASWGSIEMVESLLNSADAPKHLQYNQSLLAAIVHGLVKAKNLPKVENMVALFEEKGISLTDRAYNDILAGCLAIQDYIGFQRWQKTPFTPTGPLIYDQVTINHILAFHAQTAGCQQAIDFYEEMLTKGFIPNKFTFTQLIQSCMESGYLEKATEFYEEMKYNKIAPDGPLFIILFKGLLRYDMNLSKVEILYKDMLRSHLTPSPELGTILVKWGCMRGNASLGRYFFERMKKDGLCPDLINYTTLLHGLAKSNRLDWLYHYLDELRQSCHIPDTHFCTVLFQILLSHHHYQLILDIWNEIKSQVVVDNQLGLLLAQAALPLGCLPSLLDQWKSHITFSSWVYNHWDSILEKL